jgi:L-aminopeptidase/D-esterase-like protein
MNKYLKTALIVSNLCLCVAANSIPANASANNNTFGDRSEEENQNLENSSSFKNNNSIDLGGISTYPQDIVPARGMILNEKGQVVLTGHPTPNVPDRPATQLFDCNDLNK